MFKAHIILYHSTLGSRVIKKKNKVNGLLCRRTKRFGIWGYGFGVMGLGSCVAAALSSWVLGRGKPVQF